MSKYVYNDYILKLAQKFQAELSSIQTEYNFDLGEEFEVAICRVLRIMLPEKYGICRGFVVNTEGEKGGDDIIIFDQSRFPTLGLRDKGDFSRKEFIPAEAVYGYIEAKYTINIQGNDGQSFAKSIEQLDRVKTVCNKRKPLLWNETENIVFGGEVQPKPDSPSIRNPAWGAIISSRIRDKKGGKILTDSNEINELLKKATVSTLERPDMMIFGDNIVTLPVFRDTYKGIDTISFFHINGRTEYLTKITPSISQGIGISIMMGAFSRILLGKMPWMKIVGNGFGI